MFPTRGKARKDTNNFLISKIFAIMMNSSCLGYMQSRSCHSRRKFVKNFKKSLRIKNFVVHLQSQFKSGGGEMVDTLL